MSGKGSDRRPLSVDAQTFADNWERTFNRGVGEQSKPASSNLARDIVPTVGANPTAAATYIDDATGQ